MNRTIFITGGTSTLGRVICEQFAKQGDNIVIQYYQNKEYAYALQKELQEKFHVTILLIQGDISKEEEVKRMKKEFLNSFQKLDILINNAGIAMDDDFFEKRIADFKKVIDVNLVGTYLMSREFSKLMLDKKEGTIINISSTNGIDTYYPESTDYDISKAGIISLTHNLSHVLAPFIRVNAIAPGWFETKINAELNPKFRKEETEKILLKRFAQPEEIANVVTFLASNQASYINNTIIRVDGGY